MNRRSLIRALLAAPLAAYAGAFAQKSVPSLKFSELYGRVTVRGVEYSERIRSLKGQTVTMQGFMAPPLKPRLDFFVLTREPMSTCPFCTTAADWPADIVLVIMPDGRELEPSTRGLTVTGRLDIGVKRDDQTGFVSLVRLYADRVTTA
ncbi:hypothetical protein GCM10008959_37190 [Deinococcus seoulensis]|uniref:DUF3299 domain-containing protein n=2 Tax=Deinococcus TaxID=1298 RepID=A0ABQ2RY69_9DEIO|nr:MULTISPECIES: hypothetical protein [Deinococcus]GGR72219.1 hypothetical protein GCM10008959_37190 [Deinococcus seoulensis]GGS40071.1 hypothetical protein GCM10008961_34350 [Deinococcus knuensis]